ncbi:chorismate synthase [Heliophilum fasciatum]|nr:chorismate synthase [Heliophilum fasciatum]MCW2277306.1 chorismate synthase [Heliophilum fasciatum]
MLTAGESHGPALTAIVDGMPAGVPLEVEQIDAQLARRQKGHGRGGRMAIEQDQAVIQSGVRGGLTLGSPITLQVYNRDWANWSTVMAAGTEAALDERRVERPRPGHADLPGAVKYGHRDMRNILERSSARETAVRVAAGTVGRALLQALGIDVVSHVLAIGDVGDVDRDQAAALRSPAAWQALAAQAEHSPVRCADPALGAAMVARIDQAKAAGDSLGGVIELAVTGVPMGLGSHVQADRRLDSRIAGAMMSIQAIKGVEVGLGFSAAVRPGSLVHDEIIYDPVYGYGHCTNRAGGMEGGISNGETLVVRIAMKPIPTLYTPLKTVHIGSREVQSASVERSDVCAVPAAAVVAEAVLAWTVAQVLLETTGGDQMAQVQARVAALRQASVDF